MVNSELYIVGQSQNKGQRLEKERKMRAEPSIETVRVEVYTPRFPERTKMVIHLQDTLATSELPFSKNIKKLMIPFFGSLFPPRSCEKIEIHRSSFKVRAAGSVPESACRSVVGHDVRKGVSQISPGTIPGLLRRVNFQPRLGRSMEVVAEKVSTCMQILHGNV